MKFAPEGWRLVSPLSAAAAVCLIAWLVSHISPLLWVGLAIGVLSGLILLFFRDPERHPPADSNAVVSPADGKVILAETLPDGRRHVAVFLSVLDVHVNRAPTAAQVSKIENRPGTYFHAGSVKAAGQNARVDVEAETPHGPVSWRQVSGSIARKISCRVKPGDTLQTGERFGLIYFGSRMDVFLPASATLLTRKGVRVIAGETVIATFL